MWNCRLKGFEKKTNLAGIGHDMLMKLNKAEAAVPGCLMPARVISRMRKVMNMPRG